MKLYVHEYGFCPRVYFLSTLTSEGQDWDTLIDDRATDTSNIISLREKNKNCENKKTLQYVQYGRFHLVHGMFFWLFGYLYLFSQT
jgi:hypothetical protein